ncbi:hypothetical protein [Bythopirellula polymerisocia]|uniref:Secreted protein n=1 Tax=Bythopirellula polymerisocia TaxID=2528003 RepID=A0A5C6CJ54_9BACT|nr:hypothetical protein [Bythopirellula polymerisocia]TWU22819.1 hypothetical protein Pla144_42800 [Bythopirellula polymerisocia]
MISCYEVLYRLLCILLCVAICGCGAAEESSIPEVTPTVEEQIASPVPCQTSESENGSQEADSDKSLETDQQAAQ